MSVKFVDLKSAVIGANNLEDSERVYDIEANIHVNGTSVSGIDNGTVKIVGHENIVVTFSNWGESLSLNFNGLDTSAYCDVVEAINEFIADTKTLVAAKNVSELVV